MVFLELAQPGPETFASPVRRHLPNSLAGATSERTGAVSDVMLG